MPWLLADWTAPEKGTDGDPLRFSKGDWVPEFDRRGWHARNHLRKAIIALERGQPVAEATCGLVREEVLHALARDIGSIQRDGLFYYNALEELKRADPGGDAADTVLSRMRELDMASPGFEPSAGGPPQPASPISVRGAINWLMDRLADVGEKLLKLIRPFVALVADIWGDSNLQLFTVSVNAGLPPSLGFAFETAELHAQTSFATGLERVLRQLWSELRAVI